MNLEKHPEIIEFQQLAGSSISVADFSEHFLGIKLHEKQELWIKDSNHLINILRPGNQWGKTLITAIKHIYHAMTKPHLKFFKPDPVAFMTAEYQTLNFGKTYEVAKAVYWTILQIVGGEFLIYDPKTQDYHTNRSLIGGTVAQYEEHPLPYIRWWNKSISLFRSYDDMGSAFKMKRLAYVSGDEVGDIPELIVFVNGTILPRIVFMRGTIDLVGTPQNPNEYQDFIELAETGEGDYYIQGGRMYDNPHISPDYIQKIEAIANPELRKRIIEGMVVDVGEKFLGLEPVQNAIRKELKWDKTTGWIEQPKEKAKYCLGADFAGGKDRTVLGAVRYDVHPYKLTYLRFFKGNRVPIPMQYELVKDVFKQFKNINCQIKLIFDANALGGKNAEAYLAELHGYPFPGAYSYADAKANALGVFKTVLEENRKIAEIGGKVIDLNKIWGGIWLPDIRELRLELEGYKLDDKKIYNDFVMCLAMILWWVDMRRPKGNVRVAKDFDFAEAMIGDAKKIEPDHLHPWGQGP